MEIVIILSLILLNGFFSLSEIAIVSSKVSRLEEKKAAGSGGAKIALKLMSDSENFLSAVQVGITLIGIVTGVYGGVNIAEDLQPYLMQFAILQPYAEELALACIVVIITYISIVVGELVPKSIALANPENVAVKVAPMVSLFSTLFFPFVWLLSVSTHLINRLLRIKSHSAKVTEGELRQMLKIATHEGVIEKDQKLIHERVFYFSDKKAKHIMSHRTDVEWLDIEQPADKFYQNIIKCSHSKVLVCRGKVDDFLGVLNIKEYLLECAVNKTIEKIESMLLQPIVVPETADAQKVLNLFKLKQNYFAVVVSEYGSFEGIITLHDIMENILGSIPGDGEVAEPDMFVRADKSVLVSGDAPVETLVGIIDDFTIDFEVIDYSTVAGFVIENLDKIPQLGDKFEFGNYTIEVIDIDGNRIDKVLVSKK
jgi:putative hemolysin